MINEIFDTLDEWRNLPAYQLERRADIFFAIYLKDIIKTHLETKNEVDFIIPEFPLRTGTLYPDKILNNPNSSYKVDYIAVCNASKKVYFIELKTDDNSRRDGQDEYLYEAQSKGIKNLIDGLIQICMASKSKKKYDNLLNILSRIGWVDINTLKNTSEDYQIEIIYIQPNKKNKDDKGLIEFSDIIETLSKYNDDFTKRFVESLEKWKLNPNS